MEPWLDLAADAVDPLLALSALSAPWLDPRPGEGWAARLRFWLRAGAGIGTVYAVQGLDAAFGLHWTWTPRVIWIALAAGVIGGIAGLVMRRQPAAA